MHFTDTVYRNPYWPTWPLLQITQGCTHNNCKFCTMYRNVDFHVQPMEWIEEDLQELAESAPEARTIQLLSANPLALSYEKLVPILEMIRRYLPNIEVMYTQGRVSDLKNKTVEQLRHLKELGMREISLGVESGDDWTLDRINKGYHAEDILEQCHKLEEAGIDYVWGRRVKAIVIPKGDNRCPLEQMTANEHSPAEIVAALRHHWQQLAIARHRAGPTKLTTIN